MTLIEQEIEKRVADAIESAMAVKPAIPCRVMASLQGEPEGIAADSDAPDGLSINVRFAPRAYAEFASRATTITVEATATFQGKDFPDRDGIVPAIARIFNVFEKWNTSYPAAAAAFTIPGHFRCDGANIPGGTSQENFTSRDTDITQSIDIIGVILSEPSASPGINAAEHE